MIEKKLIEYLSDSMEVPVYAEEPDTSETAFLVIEKTGSSAQENCLFTSMIAVKSYGATLSEAARLNEETKTAMFDAASIPEVTEVILNSDYNFTDTRKKKYRYQAVFEITHY